MSDAPLPPLGPDDLPTGIDPDPPADPPGPPDDPPPPTPPPTPTTGSTRTMTTTPFKIQRGEFGLSLTQPANWSDISLATIADFTDFSCQVTQGLITASQNFETDEVPGTFCDPASETIKPSATTFALELAVLQDPQQDTIAGLAKFLYDNDSGMTGSPAWFYLGLAQGAAPKAQGICYLAPMDFGGEPRVTLVAQLQLPVEGRPQLEFGTAADA